MKKFFIVGSTLIVLFVTLYTLIFWNPEIESKSVISDNISYESEEDKSLIKINANDLLNKLNKKEKEELKDILMKVSVIDIGKIEEYISTNDNKGIKNALSLLEKRLSKDDYIKIKEILEPYLDLSLVN